jgi:SH3-like domain-containing protein
MAVTRQSIGAAIMVLALLGLPGASARAAGDITTGSVSGLPVPRFVSLKADKVKVRQGPSLDQDVRWIYTRAGLPLEITAEFENWRRVRDWEGSEGWVYHSLLSGRRTAVVVPTLKNELVPLYGSPDAKAAVVAKLEAGVVGSLKTCNGSWCEFAGKGFEGWIKQDRLWGAYPNEKLE